MRNISQSLKNKLAEKWQVKANDAQPNLRIVATQATVNTLISETIHDNIPANFGDVAIRQLPNELTPSKVYALCIDSGIAIYEGVFSLSKIENQYLLSFFGKSQMLTIILYIRVAKSEKSQIG